MSKSYLVSKIDMFGKSVPMYVCDGKAEADAMIDTLEAALPKGELSFFSREPVLSVTAHKELVAVLKVPALISA